MPKKGPSGRTVQVITVVAAGDGDGVNGNGVGAEVGVAVNVTMASIVAVASAGAVAAGSVVGIAVGVMDRGVAVNVGVGEAVALSTAGVLVTGLVASAAGVGDGRNAVPRLQPNTTRHTTAATRHLATGRSTKHLPIRLIAPPLLSVDY